MCYIVPLHSTEIKSWISQVQKLTHHRRNQRLLVLFHFHAVFRKTFSCPSAPLNRQSRLSPCALTVVINQYRHGSIFKINVLSSSQVPPHPFPCIRVKFKSVNPNFRCFHNYHSRVSKKGGGGPRTLSLSLGPISLIFIQFSFKVDNPGSATEKVQQISLMIRIENF